jgi:transcriptional antiterminator NusG
MNANEPEIKQTEGNMENATPVSTDGAESVLKKAAEDMAKWFVIHSQTGHEARVKTALEQRIVSLGMEHKIFQVVIPTREIVVVKKGKKTKQKERVFPGYILIKMIMDDDSWLVVRTTEGVTGFIGAGLKPSPISEKEVNAIMKFVQQEQPKFKAKFSVGEAVKITDGPFSDFLGSIEAIDEEKGKVRVLVSIFDRETPVELDFLQVAKL